MTLIAAITFICGLIIGISLGLRIDSHAIMDSLRKRGYCPMGGGYAILGSVVHVASQIETRPDGSKIINTGTSKIHLNSSKIDLN